MCGYSLVLGVKYGNVKGMLNRIFGRERNVQIFRNVHFSPKKRPKKVRIKFAELEKVPTFASAFES